MDERDVIASALTDEPDLKPSPGFTHRVLREVHRAAEEPAPLPFPWRYFAAGALAMAGLVVAALWLVVEAGITAGSDGASSTASLPSGSIALGVSLAVASVLGSLVAVRRTLTPGRRTGF